MTVVAGLMVLASLTFGRRLILSGAQVKRRRRGRSQNTCGSLDLLHEKKII